MDYFSLDLKSRFYAGCFAEARVIPRNILVYCSEEGLPNNGKTRESHCQRLCHSMYSTFWINVYEQHQCGKRYDMV